MRIDEHGFLDSRKERKGRKGKDNILLFASFAFFARDIPLFIHPSFSMSRRRDSGMWWHVRARAV